MDYFYDIAGVFPRRTALDTKYREELREALEYLREDPTVERGVLISTDFEWFPFENTVEAPYNKALIRMGRSEDFQKLCELQFSGKLLGWLHSHPQFVAYPSLTDLEFHNFDGHMLIYSIRDDVLNVFKTDYISYLDGDVTKATGHLKTYV